MLYRMIGANLVFVAQATDQIFYFFYVIPASHVLPINASIQYIICSTNRLLL